MMNFVLVTQSSTSSSSLMSLTLRPTNNRQLMIALKSDGDGDVVVKNED